MVLRHCVDSILNKNQIIIPKNMNFNFVTWFVRRSWPLRAKLNNFVLVLWLIYFRLKKNKKKKFLDMKLLLHLIFVKIFFFFPIKNRLIIELRQKYFFFPWVVNFIVIFQSAKPRNKVIIHFFSHKEWIFFKIKIFFLKMAQHHLILVKKIFFFFPS
jgi:hypothetical protein